MPLSSIIVWLFSKKFAGAYRELMGQLSEVQSYLVEAVSGAAALKALNAEDSVYDEYEKRQLKAVKTGYTLGITRTLQTFFTGLLDGWSGNIIFWAGSYLILKDRFTIGQLFSFNALLVYFTGPLKRLLTLQPTLQEGAVAADRLGEIFDLKKEIADEGRWIKPEKIVGNIEIKGLIFRYGTRKPVLNNISLTINAGESIGFVGASGSGKTSLIKLLLKFYSPESGSIKIDGYNIEDIDTKALRAKIGYVPQDIFLFSGTIAENIAMHDEGASIEDIIKVSIETGVHSFVENLPERYNTVLAERGISLSGGERQRIALARALISDPDLLIFDEATSNLDTISEKQIHGIIENIKTKKITTLMIAHRLTTVKNCDKIFVMQNGIIVEEGKHASLLEKKGLYYRLWNGDVL
ncbi:MAG: peptidase domain-containing ABC transporter [Treponema sp.]